MNTLAEGGTYGTDGYCPPELAAQAGAGDTRVAPYSDRYGRDMLLLELLFMDCALSPDDPPARWASDQLQRRYTAWRARSDPQHWQALTHLELSTVFAIEERQRPTSTELAAGLGLSLPGRRMLRPVAYPWWSTPAMLDYRPAKPRVPQRRRRSTSAAGQAPTQWATAAATRGAMAQQSQTRYQPPISETGETAIIVLAVALALSPWIVLVLAIFGVCFR